MPIASKRRAANYYPATPPRKRRSNLTELFETQLNDSVSEVKDKRIFLALGSILHLVVAELGPNSAGFTVSLIISDVAYGMVSDRDDHVRISVVDRLVDGRGQGLTGAGPTYRQICAAESTRRQP